MRSVFSALLMAVALAGCLMAVTTRSAGAQAAGAVTSVWLTTADGNTRLAAQPIVQFAADGGSNPLTVDVDATTTYQPIDGFGASFTDSSAWLVYNTLSSTARGQLMMQLFDRASGIGLSYLRQPIGASDFALSNYTYDDMPAGQTDASLAHFSIDHDRAYLLPILQQALQINPNLGVMATPWSAPAWMKSSQSLVGGSLNASAMSAYAAYLTRFVQAYEAAGVPVSRITPQNEPHYSPSSNPGMYMEYTQEADLVKNYLGPALANAGLRTRIAVWDQNWDDTSYAENILADSAAYPYVSGSAWHCYAGAPSAMATVHAAYPGRDIYLTECTAGAWSTSFGGNLAWDMENLIIGGVRNWARSITKFNIALDTHDGPQNGGCTNCTGLVTIDQATGAVTFNYDYFALGHVSKFVVPGAHRIASNTFGGGSIEDVAFLNPDGSRVVVVLNSSGSAQTLKLREGTQSLTYTMPAGAVATFTWSPAAGTSGGGGSGSGGTSSNLPSPWTDGDVGSVGLAGSAAFSTTTSTFTIKGAGADIWGAADSFNYVHQPLAGDGQIVARVTSLQNTNAYAKAGVMLRETLGAGASEVTVDVKPGGGIEFLSRTATGSSTTCVGSTASAPVWMKIVRAGTTITGYVSADGGTWTKAGSVTLTLATSVYVGLAVTSHDTAALNTAAFDNVTVAAATSATAPPPATSSLRFANQDVGSAGLAGSVSLSNGTYTVKGAGADVWGTSDSFNFTYQPLAGNGEIVARVASLQNTDTYAKAGVMIRGAMTAGASSAVLDVKPGGGLEFLVRTTVGGSTAVTATGTGAAPVWLKLTRSGTTITAYSSGDGRSWTKVGSATTSMASGAYVGLAVCSHNTAALATSTFDNVAAFSDADVGSVGLAGTGDVAGGVYTVTGAGADVWGTADAFHYTYMPLPGNGQIVARVLAVQNTNAYAKAGIMIRETTAASASSVMLDVKPGGGVELLARSSMAASTSYVAGTSVAAPTWLKLVRSGTTITGYTSPDGTTWTAVANVSVPMASTAYAGVAVCSHNTAALNTSTFDNVVVQ